ncbi:MAG: glycosyltransferase, partial [Patescibacteria group bacterium]|nr:glycosyltransferase [Patescibacteria group bacterium]
MKVSIIIPVYNVEKYLNDCIRSALNQTYRDIEIIAIDDGSKDNSMRILEQYSDKIKVISKPNGGTASALNVGIKNMTGVWFKWLSADDVLYPNALEEMISESSKIENKENTIFYSNYDIVNSDGKIVNKFIEPNYNELESFQQHVILLDHYFGNGTTSLIHRSAIEKYGLFDETIGYKEDYELWLRYCVLHNCRLYLIPKILAKYRVHQKQLTKEKATISLSQTNRIRKFILDKIEPEKRKKYESAIKEYQKTKSTAI